MRTRCVDLKFFFLLAGIAGAILLSIGFKALAQHPVESQLFGDWRGESICQVKNSPCHDEEVVYHISKGKQHGTVVVSADKIVNGKPVSMGSGDYRYDEPTGTLTNGAGGRIWKLIVGGKTMAGTLTLPDKTIYRRVTLKKKEQE